MSWRPLVWPMRLNSFANCRLSTRLLVVCLLLSLVLFLLVICACKASKTQKTNKTKSKKTSFAPVASLNKLNTHSSTIICTFWSLLLLLLLSCKQKQTPNYDKDNCQTTRNNNNKIVSTQTKHKIF